MSKAQPRMQIASTVALYPVQRSLDMTGTAPAPCAVDIAMDRFLPSWSRSAADDRPGRSRGTSRRSRQQCCHDAIADLTGGPYGPKQSGYRRDCAIWRNVMTVQALGYVGVRAQGIEDW